MQQDTFFYPNFAPDPRLQYASANSFPAQSNVAPWAGNYIPEVNLNPSQDVPNPFDYGNQLQPNNAIPLSTADFTSSPTFSWAHTVPSLMPWVTRGNSNVPDPIVRFTAPFPPDPCTSQTATSWELLNNLGGNKTNVNMHLKRKSDLDVIDATTPHKVCITEERMAARLKELHISNQYSVPAENSPFGPYGNSSNSNVDEKSVTNLQQLEAMLNESNPDGSVSSKSLILAPEIKKLVEPEKIFAKTFLDKVERPSMAVVLWQPQNKLLSNVNNNSSDSKTDEEKEPEDSSISALKRNHNFLCQQLSAISNQDSPFTIDGSNKDSSSVISEDVMDT